MSKRLTRDENTALKHLMVSWNVFVDLERLHPDEVDEFRAAIHTAQRIIMVRPILRENALSLDSVARLVRKRKSIRE